MGFHKKVLWSSLVLFVIPIVVVVVGTKIADHVSATSEIEYATKSIDDLLAIPQGIENRVAVVLDGKPHKNISLLRIAMFNRASHSFGDVPIQIRLPTGTPPPIAKMLVYPSEQQAEQFAWDSADPANLRFTAKAMNNSWSTVPFVNLNLFFDGDHTPEVTLSTTKAGIVFVPLDESKYVLFRYDYLLGNCLPSRQILSGARFWKS